MLAYCQVKLDILICREGSFTARMSQHVLMIKHENRGCLTFLLTLKETTGLFLCEYFWFFKIIVESLNVMFPPLLLWFQGNFMVFAHGGYSFWAFHGEILQKQNRKLISSTS